MDAQVLNFKPYSSGAMVGFFDLVVGGIVVTSCRAFKKEDKLWFSWPSEKTGEERDGKAVYREIVTAAAPVMAHLQNAVRGQLRALMDAPAERPAATAAARQKPRPGAYRTPEGEDLSQYRTKPGADGIPF